MRETGGGAGWVDKGKDSFLRVFLLFTMLFPCTVSVSCGFFK